MCVNVTIIIDLYLFPFFNDFFWIYYIFTCTYKIKNDIGARNKIPDKEKPLKNNI